MCMQSEAGLYVTLGSDYPAIPDLAAHPVQLTNKPIYLGIAGVKDLALSYTRYKAVTEEDRGIAMGQTMIWRWRSILAIFGSGSG